MTMKKILIIFLSLMLAVSCASKLAPVAQDFSQEGGGGHLNDFGNDDLIDPGKGDDTTDTVGSFINKYAGLYYESGKVTYKLYNGKLYENTGWRFEEISNGITVDPNGNKMQISNKGGLGTIEVLNFRKEGDDKDGFSRHHLNILTRDDSVVEHLVSGKVATYPELRDYKGTYKDINGNAFLSIDSDGGVFFKETLRIGYYGLDKTSGDLFIIDKDNTKNIIKLQEGVYKKYSRTGQDVSVDSSSVTRDFIESLGEVQYTDNNIYIEFNKFDQASSTAFGKVESFPGGVKIVQNGTGGSKVGKRSILKGKTLTVYNEGNGKTIDWTLTFNEDNSIATYDKGGVKLNLTKINN